MILDGFVPYFYITAKLLVTFASNTALWAMSTNVLKMLSKMVYSHNKFTNFFQFQMKELTFGIIWQLVYFSYDSKAGSVILRNIK